MRRNREKTSLVKRRGTKFYENFTIRGQKFRRSLGTDDRATAEILAAETRKHALLGNLITKRREMKLGEALARYWIEHGRRLPSAGSIAGRSVALEAGLGKDILLSEITPAHLITYAESRREGWMTHPRTGTRWPITRGPGTINSELRQVQTILIRASRVWDVAAAKLNMKDILLREPADRQYILSQEDEDRLFAALRPDLHAMVRFALVTGLRVGNVIKLTWRQINWDAGHIEFHTKSKKPGGELFYLPITNAMAAILSVERGRHPEFVFTFVALKNTYSPARGVRRIKGERYPFPSERQGAWYYSWLQAVTAAGLRFGKRNRANFRFHDLRHTAATRTLKATQNLKTVQKMLGHAFITTTTRYAKTDVEDVREAMEKVWEKAQTAHIAIVKRRKG